MTSTNLKLTSFYTFIGELIMYFQLIERDLKIIYSSIVSDKFYQEYSTLDYASLGQIITLLKDKQYFLDYEIIQLKSLRNKRNFYVHQSFLSFIDNDDFLNSNEYNDICIRLIKDHNLFENLCMKVSKLSKELIKKEKL